MTPQSLAAAFLATVLVGGSVSWLLRRKRMAGEIAFAVSFFVGVAVLQCSQPADLLRPFRPAVAADWLPMTVVLAVVLLATTRRLSTYRIGVAVVLATATTVRLLWGSVYFRDVSLNSVSENAGVFGLVAGWAIAIGVVLAVQRPAARKRFDGTVIAWALATGLTAASIALTGSITYGALTGVVGVAALTSVVASGRLPVLAATPVVFLVGLAVAFSEMPIALAAALLLAWIGLVASAGESLSVGSARRQRVNRSVRVASAVAMGVAFGVVAAQLAESSGSSSSGYGVAATAANGPAAEAQIEESEGTQAVEADEAEVDSGFIDASEGRPDPFGGFGL